MCLQGKAAGAVRASTCLPAVPRACSTTRCTHVLLEPAPPIPAPTTGLHSLLLSSVCFSGPRVCNRGSQRCSTVPCFWQVLWDNALPTRLPPCLHTMQRK